MKRMRKNDLWYNAHDKEIGGILLEGRESVLRGGGPCSDVRMGLRFLGVCSGFRTDNL